MTIQFIANPKDTASLIYHYLLDHPTAFPPDVRDWIVGFLEPETSLTFGVAETAEVIFARKNELMPEDLNLGATVATTANYHKLNNFADDFGNRGDGIYKALMRVAGEPPPEGTEWPPEEEDPMPKDIYLPPPPLEEGDVSKLAPHIQPPEPGTGSTPTPPEPEPLELTDRAEK